MGWARPLVAFGSGALWAFGFGSEAQLVAPWIALVPFFLLLSGPRPGLCGWLHGLGFWIVGVSWIPATLRTFGSLPAWLSVFALVLLAAYLGLFHALFARLAASTWRRRPELSLAVLPAAWVVCEVARGFGPAGFPWNLAGYSAVGVPGALEATAWVGTFGLSAVVVLVNASIARSIADRSLQPALWTVLAVLSFLALAGRVSLTAIETGDTRRVALLQPNIPNMTQWDPVLADANYRQVLAQSRRACLPGELLIWPESAAWPYDYEPGSRLERDVRGLLAAGCGVLFNSPVREQGSFFNSALLELPQSSASRQGRYDKQRLVPFGEYVPLGRWIPWLERVARAAGDFSPGPRSGNLEWHGDAVAMSICFEVTFPADVAAKVKRGAGVLATVTNDAWYGDTWAPWQHLTAARFRAAENRRPLLRAAITGVSAVIGPRGELRQTLGVDERGILRAAVVPGENLALYTRAPHAVSLTSFAVLGFAIFRGAGRRSAERRAR